MARTVATNFSGALQYPYATAGTDLFKKEDVQTLALAVDGHDHSTGKGLPLAAGSIPSGTITSAMIANGTIVAADIATGTITSNEIADGTIATADLANASVTNAKLAADTDRSNLLVDGGFEIWQRGTGPFTAQGAFAADRWQIFLSGTDTLSVSKDLANQDNASIACAALTYTRNTGASAFYQVMNRADGLDWRNRTMSCSMRVKTSIANAARLALYDGTNAVFSYSNYHSGGGAYETLTVTAALPGSCNSLQVQVVLNASCTVYLDNAMLVVGSVAADYAPLHPADDLARCLRYYEAFGRSSSQNMWGAALNWSTLNGTALHYWKVVKAVIPTVTFTAANTFSAQVGGILTSISATAQAVDATGIGYVLTSAVAVNSGNFISVNGTGPATMFAEANP